MGPCEGCGVEPKGDYGLHNYCVVCSKNLCDQCLGEHSCPDTADGAHIPAGEDDESEEDDAPLVDA